MFAIAGCARSPLSKVQQEVETQVQLLIDSGYVQNKYVVLYELVINDSNHIYMIADSEFPVEANLELPSKITKYKDKYLCFVELDEPEMSVKEMEKITDYSGNPIVETDYTFKWLFAVSKFGEKKVLVNFVKDGRYFFEYKELLPYFLGYVEDCPVQMGVISHDIRIYPRQTFNVDSVKHQLLGSVRNIYGKIYLKNNTDSVVCLSSDTQKHYAVISNQDSLYLSLCDSLPIILEPHESKIIEYESISNARFFNNLASEEEPWDYLYNLFCDSTYCLMKINRKDLKTRVMFLDSTDGFKVINEEGEQVFSLLKHNIYDKEERRIRNTKYWWNPERGK